MKAKNLLNQIDQRVIPIPGPVDIRAMLVAIIEDIEEIDKRLKTIEDQPKLGYP